MARVIPAPKLSPAQNALVIQSDDWGYCGWTATREGFERLKPLLERRYGLKGRIWGSSTLETPHDMELLFQLLEQHRDATGRPAAFQAGYVTGNPDYDRMKRDRFRVLHRLLLPEIPEMWRRGDIVAKAKEGMARKVWRPVFHGVSHFNAGGWVERLQGDREAFDAACEGCFMGDGTGGDFEYGEKTETSQIPSLIRDGVAAFRHSFGFAPDAAIFPAYYWPHEAEIALAREGVGILHGKNCQIRKQSTVERCRGKLYNLLGWKDSAKAWQISCGDRRPDLGLRYLARNVFFEPYLDWAWHAKKPQETVNAALAAVEQAWSRGEPAVMITHRINYVGWHGETGRSLDCLDRLLTLLRERSDFRFWGDREAAMGGADDGSD